VYSTSGVSETVIDATDMVFWPALRAPTSS
jgi:hypothetical protein